MSSNGPDGQPQIHLGAPSQVQLSQMQPPMQSQMRPQPVIHHTMSVHMPQAPNIVCMQRPQIAKTGQLAVDKPVTPFVGGQTRMPAGGQMPQQVHVISQGMLQPQSQAQTAYMTTDAGHGMQVGMIDQQRSMVTRRVLLMGSRVMHICQQCRYFKWELLVSSSSELRRSACCYILPLMTIEGVQQPVYGTTLRVGAPSVQSPVSNSNAPIRFISNNNNASAMHLVTQPNQVQVSPQQHFISAETQQQQRMVVPQPRANGPTMKIIPSSQQTLVSQGGGGSQTATRSATNAMVQPQRQQPGEHAAGTQVIHTLTTATATPSGAAGPATPEQQQQQQQRYLMVLESAMQQVRIHQPDADMKNYHQLKALLERDKIPPQNMGRIEMFIRQLQQDPFHLLQKRTAQQQQHQGVVVVGSSGAVSEEAPQKLLAQKRVAQAQRFVPPGIRPTIATSSSLNSLLSQPVDPPEAGICPYPGQMTSQSAAAAATARHMQQQQQQQQMIVTSEQAHQPPADPFQAAMDKLAKEFMTLEKQVGRVRFTRAMNEVSEETRELRETTGHVLPRDVFPSPLPVAKVAVEAESSEKDEMNFRIGCKRVRGGEKVEGDFGSADGDRQMCDPKRSKVGGVERRTMAEVPIHVGAEDRLVYSGKSSMDVHLTMEDINPRLRQELGRIRESLEGVEISLAHPHQGSTSSAEAYPSMEEMENHVTCRDLAEWNSSLHLEVLFTDKLMPCRVPPLFVRLPPDYLSLPRVNWLVRRSDFMVHSQVEWSGEGNSFYTRDEVTAFRKTASTLVVQFLEGLRLRQRLADQLTLFTVTEVWASFVSSLVEPCLRNRVKSILMAIARFMTFGI
ncbi:Ras guanine nucleotide exchange factor [Echinococcus granulosus]|uniref:Ras guanine nucleotide exchange factor n=1 Tax=Echinococcus granulosus TaxID=6210 RepID=W6UQ72_ECHGR|nr:Ras guanine nucleotide exchange factor [Echinococcus granulosus]EUB63393.1 Ras guanine nucleotide exchange factor [Echinococcus granulosus]